MRDLAILEFSPDPTYDLTPIPIEAAATESRISHAGIGPGLDVVYPSLFHSHPGDSRNVPLMRVGSLAALADQSEPIYIKEKAAEMVGHIVEARSISGVSGSPVFVGFPAARTIRDQGKQGTVLRMSTRPQFFLMGVMVSHWELAAEGPDPVNTGLSIVVPATVLIDEIEDL